MDNEKSSDKATDKPRYSLDELLAQCDISKAMPEGLAEWDFVPPAGDEIL